MSGYPEAPEAIALILLDKIMADEAEPEPAPRRNRCRKDQILDVYAECLNAVVGKRPPPLEIALH